MVVKLLQHLIDRLLFLHFLVVYLYFCATLNVFYWTIVMVSNHFFVYCLFAVYFLLCSSTYRVNKKLLLARQVLERK